MRERSLAGHRELATLDPVAHLGRSGLELAGGEHVDAPVLTDGEVAALTQARAIHGGQRYSTFVVELTLMEPEEHRARPALSTFTPRRLPTWEPRGGSHRPPLCPPRW